MNETERVDLGRKRYRLEKNLISVLYQVNKMLRISIYAGMHPCFNQTKQLFNAPSYEATRRIVKPFLGAVRHYDINFLAKKKTKP